MDAENSHFTDASGKKYLDFSAQLMCSNLGHKNRAVIDAIKEQAEKLCFVAPGFATDTRAKLAKLLLEVLPKGLDKFFFATSGTEANECAIKMARAYTGKYKIIARYASYHGSTAGSIAATGDLRRWFAEPTGKIDGVYKERLLKGLDEVGLLLQHLPEIEAFEKRHHGEHGWLA